MENQEIVVEVKKMSDLINNIKESAEKKSADITATLEAKLAEYKAASETKSGEELKAIQKEMQDQYDAFVSNKSAHAPKATKSIEDALAEKLGEYKFGQEGVENEFSNELRHKKSIRFDFPEIKAMGLNNLTGDAVASYGPRQAILPAQKVNFRDLVPTLNTETGLYVFYKETATPNNIAKQSEGSTKGENTYAFSETKVVQQYIAGFSTFTKQMATSLPFLSQTLPRMLMRDYFKKENALFNASVTGLATVDTSTETDKVKKIIDFIASQQDLDYNASYVIVSHTDMAELVKSTYTNGYYAGAGMVNLPGLGMTIMGVPVIAASWATAGKALIIDADFIERVQVKGLAIELSYENGTNFVQNQVTARIECQTEINLMLGASAAFGTL